MVDDMAIWARRVLAVFGIGLVAAVFVPVAAGAWPWDTWFKDPIPITVSGHVECQDFSLAAIDYPGLQLNAPVEWVKINGIPDSEVLSRDFPYDTQYSIDVVEGWVVEAFVKCAGDQKVHAIPPFKVDGQILTSSSTQTRHLCVGGTPLQPCAPVELGGCLLAWFSAGGRIVQLESGRFIRNADDLIAELALAGLGEGPSDLEACIYALTNSRVDIPLLRHEERQIPEAPLDTIPELEIGPIDTLAPVTASSAAPVTASSAAPVTATSAAPVTATSAAPVTATSSAETADPCQPRITYFGAREPEIHTPSGIERRALEFTISTDGCELVRVEGRRIGFSSGEWAKVQNFHGAFFRSWNQGGASTTIWYPCSSLASGTVSYQIDIFGESDVFEGTATSRPVSAPSCPESSATTTPEIPMYSARSWEGGNVKAFERIGAGGSFRELPRDASIAILCKGFVANDIDSNNGWYFRLAESGFEGLWAAATAFDSQDAGRGHSFRFGDAPENDVPEC